jgi:Protein of unknown function (DUF1572)
MNDVICAGFVKALRNYATRVHQWAAPLDEQQFWSKPFDHGNSFGHLVLHLTGNLNYYLGQQLLNTGYIRNRELEFTDPNPPTKSEALARFDAAVEVAMRAVESQTPDYWARDYQATGMPEGMNRFDAVMQCTAHIYHHVGQMIYIHKQWMHADKGS